MLRVSLVFIVTILVVLATALIVLGVYITSRRSAADWRTQWQQNNQRWADADQRAELNQTVQPRRASFDEMLNNDANRGSGYFDAQRASQNLARKYAPQTPSASAGEDSADFAAGNAPEPASGVDATDRSESA